MKKLINSPENLVHEMCNGFVMAHTQLAFLPEFKVICQKKANPNKVTLISGGGSGHEPAHAGFVGTGMLDAAVCGDVFASPSQVQVYKAIQHVGGKAGTLLIIKNYSGDIMNFKNGAHLAAQEGSLVDYVCVADDIAVQDSLYTVGRRGVAGTVFVHKIAGAAAAQGKNLQQVKAAAQKAANNVRSLGFALTSCTVPAKGTPTFHLDETEMEFGVGIHGEPGIKKEPMQEANVLAKRLVQALCDDLKLSEENARVAVLVNGFGATPLMELYLMNNAVMFELNEKNITPVRTLVGNYMTSIDMAGASISILHLDDELEELLNCPCNTPALHVAGPVAPPVYTPVYAQNGNNKFSSKVETAANYAKVRETFTLENMIYTIDLMSQCIIANEKPFCELDSHAGDGDFGMSIAKGFKQLKREWGGIIKTKNLNIGSFLNACALIIMEHCGGASGPIWGSAFRAAALQAGNDESLTLAKFAQLLSAAASGVQTTGKRSFGRGAVVGDKTLIDALVPCANVWEKLAENPETSFEKAFEEGRKAAIDGAKKTEGFAARMGRAGTVGERSIGYPDAGAHALGVIFTDIKNGLEFCT